MISSFAVRAISQFRSALHSQFRWCRSYLISISIKLHQHTKCIRYGITGNILRITSMWNVMSKCDVTLDIRPQRINLIDINWIRNKFHWNRSEIEVIYLFHRWKVTFSRFIIWAPTIIRSAKLAWKLTITNITWLDLPELGRTAHYKLMTTICSLITRRVS